MATVKVKRVELIAKIRASIERDIQDRILREIAYSGTALNVAEREVKDCQRRLTEARAHLRKVKSGKTDTEKQVRAKFSDSYLDREIRLLEMSDEEYIRIGTTSNWVRYI